MLKSKFNDIEHVIAKTMEYLSIPSVVGFEQVFMRHLQHDFQQLGLSAVAYPGVLAVSGKRPDDAIICAHIDRHGLISIGGNEFVYAAQYIREIKYGQHNQTSQEEIRSIAARFEGERLYAYDPHNGVILEEGTIRSCSPWKLKGDALFEVEHSRFIDFGIPLAYARTAKMKNGYLKGQIDNTLSVAVVYALFRDGFEGTALLSTEEEIGKSWVHITRYLESHRIETKNLLVLDTSPFSDADPIKEGRIIFRNRDMSEVFDRDLTERLKKRCRGLNLPYQVKDKYLLELGRTIDQLGSTELGKVIKNSEGRWSGSTIQIPTLLYHTSYETTSRQALTHFYDFLRHILIDQPMKFDIKAGETATA